MKTKTNKHFDRKNVITLLVALLAFYIFIPQLSYFKDSFVTIAHADFAYIALCLIFLLTTFLAAAAVYVFIALKPLGYRLTLFIQLASGFTNRLAPAGAGATALNVQYLLKHSHKPVQAATVVALNNLLGFLGTIILLAGAILLDPAPIDTHINIPSTPLLFVALGLIVGLGIVILIRSKLVQKITVTLRQLARGIAHRPLRLIQALLFSMIITVSYSLLLYFVGLAFNVHLSIAQTFLVLTVGVAIATITPTPGGIGGAEAGMTAALVSVGVSSHQALTVALTYRFFVYWLPIIPGLICFRIALRKRYI